VEADLILAQASGYPGTTQFLAKITDGLQAACPAAVHGSFSGCHVRQDGH